MKITVNQLKQIICEEVSKVKRNILKTSDFSHEDEFSGNYNDEVDDDYTDSENQQLAFDTYQEALSDFCQYTADSLGEVDFENYESFIEEAADNFFEEYDGQWQEWVEVLKMSKEEIGADIRNGIDFSLEQTPFASDEPHLS